MKKLFLVFTVVLSMSFVNAQGIQLVEDLQDIACNIENGITMYQNLVNSINQYKAIIQELEQAQKNFATMDFSKYFDYSNFDPNNVNKWLDGSNVSSLWHGSWDGGVGLINSFQNDVDYMNGILHKKRFQVGNVKFSIDDLFTEDSRNAIWEDAKSMYTSSNDPDRDIKVAQFYAKHGISFNHYQRMKLYSDIVVDTANMMVTTGLASEAEMVERNKELAALAELMAEEDPGEAQRLQAAQMAAYSSAMSAHNIALEIARVGQLMGYEAGYKLQQMEEDQCTLNEMSNLGTGTYKISKSAFREIAGEENYTGPDKYGYKYPVAKKTNLFEAKDEEKQKGGL